MYAIVTRKRATKRSLQFPAVLVRHVVTPKTRTDIQTVAVIPRTQKFSPVKRATGAACGPEPPRKRLCTRSCDEPSTSSDARSTRYSSSDTQKVRAVFSHAIITAKYDDNGDIVNPNPEDQRIDPPSVANFYVESAQADFVRYQQGLTPPTKYGCDAQETPFCEEVGAKSEWNLHHIESALNRAI